MTPRGRGGGGRAQAARVAAVVEPVATRAGYDLEDVAVSRVGRRHLVRVVIDSDAGVDLDTAAELSRSLSGALDAVEESGGDLFPGEYVLEVSSPGVERPLTEPRHWRRNVGRLVTVPDPDAAGHRPLTGRVVAADDAEVTLDVDGTTRHLPHATLGAGQVEVELRREDGGADGGDADGGEDAGGEDAGRGADHGDEAGKDGPT